jgi:UDP-N-acetylmuramoyl-L-alanyl-D-glutamate--2,6-diaminopimelate ligase
MIRFEEIPALLADLLCGEAQGDWPSGLVASVEQDSRRICSPGLFGCIRGIRDDGRAYIDDAAARGALAVVGGPPPVGQLPYLSVRDPRKALALLAAKHAGDPSHDLDVIGITGTNGKTTTSWIVQSVWEACGIPTAVLGTLGSGRPGAIRAASHTTPDAPHFQTLLRDLVREEYRAVAAEISSHGLDQDRTYGTRFRSVVFTNLTRDHLDYHGTFDAYRDAKRKLFHRSTRGDDAESVAVVNMDDPATAEIIRGATDPIFGFGTSRACSVRLLNMDAGVSGVALDVATPHGSRRVAAPLLGRTNGWNVLAAYATALAVGLPVDRVEEALRRSVRVPGRLELIDKGQPFLVVIDYAHSPDALARTLETLRSLTRGRLIVLFGCGGDRDAGKRPEMGAIAAARADGIVLTNDNPRSEDPLRILDAIRDGVRAEGREPDLVVADRQEAIHAALKMAHEGDTVLLAGKGHEDYQETASGKVPFDDRAVAEGGLVRLGWDR